MQTGDPSSEIPDQRVTTGVRKVRTNRSRRRSFLVSAGGLAVAGATGAVMILMSSPASYAAGDSPAPMSHEMAGMDMSGTPTQAPMSGDMPGMDHGSGGAPVNAPSSDSPVSKPEATISGPHQGAEGSTEHSHASTKKPSTSGDMPGMDMPGDAHQHGATGASTPKPLVPVLGTFGGASAAVMLSAGMMRQKDRGKLRAKKATRAARRSGK
jgi:hypothetical protein